MKAFSWMKSNEFWMNDRPTGLPGQTSDRPTVTTSTTPTTTLNPKNHNKWHSHALPLSVAPWLMYKTLRALISYYSLFLYAIRTSISVFVVVHKKHISATTTTLRERKRARTGQRAGQTGDSGTASWMWYGRQSQQQAASKRPARCLLSARKSVYF